MASASPAPAPRASSTLAVGVYFHEFSNLDLLSQGWYAVRCRARLADDGTASRAPRWASAVGVTPAPMHPDRAAECVPPNPSLDWRLDGDRPSRSEGADDDDDDDDAAAAAALSRASSSSSPGAYTTRAFEVRYARERFPVEHLVRFEFLLDPRADDVALASVVVDFELLHVPYTSRDRARPDAARPPARAHLERAIVAVDRVVIAQAPGGVHEYHPVHFDETHLTLCDVTLHAAVVRTSVDPAAAAAASNDAASRARLIAPLLDAAEATRAVVTLAAPGGFAAGEDGSWSAALDARDDPEGTVARRLDEADAVLRGDGARADFADALASASSASREAWDAFVDAVARGGGERGGGGGWVLSPTRARWERRRDDEWSPWIARSSAEKPSAEKPSADAADAADVVVRIASDGSARTPRTNDAGVKSACRSRRLFRDETHASHASSPTVTMEDAVPAPPPPRASLAATLAASRSRVARLARDDSYPSGGGSSSAESTPAGSDVEDDESPAAEAERRRRRRRRRRLSADGSADGREGDDDDEGTGGGSPSSRSRGGLMAAAMEAAKGLPQGEHVVVLAHGFAGSLRDLRLIRAHLSAVAPNAHTVVSSANHGRTSTSSLEEMGARLATETAAAMERLEAEGWCVRGGGRRPRCAATAAAEAAAREGARPRLSFVGHSIGCLVIRAAMTHPALAPHLDRLHTFLSISGPHLGYGGDPSEPADDGAAASAASSVGCFARVRCRSRRSTFEWALRAFGRVAVRAECLREITLSDARRPEDGYLWRLARDPRASLCKFRHVVLVSSPQDGYVPRGSARVDADVVLAETADADRGGEGDETRERRGGSNARARARREMARAMLSPVLDKARDLRGADARLRRETVTSLCLVDVHFPRPRRRSLSAWIGRKAHIDFLETHAWIKYVLWAHRDKFA